MDKEMDMDNKEPRKRGRPRKYDDSTKPQRTSVFVTEGLIKEMDVICRQAMITRSSFANHALANYLRKDPSHQVIDRRILITERTNPEYIKRDERIFVFINPMLKEGLSKVAKANDCSEACVIFQALTDWLVTVKISSHSIYPTMNG